MKRMATFGDAANQSTSAIGSERHLVLLFFNRWGFLMRCSAFHAAVPVLCLLAASWNAVTTAVEPSGSTTPVVLHLHTEFLPYERLNEDDLHYRLGRELVRQAFLLAARDELALMTCDETLHETPPLNAKVVDLMLIERVNSSGMWRLSLIVPKEGQNIHKTKPLWTKSFKSAVGGVRVYGFLAPKLEEYSRGDFVEALRLAGLEGKKPTIGKSTPPSDEIEKALFEVDFITQFGAVRSAHQAIATHGETPERLSVLVRGYANLAMLTQHQWNSSSEVFTARGWLYAQRMYANKKARDLAIWNRAYAWALGGTLQHALEDLERLERRQTEWEIDPTAFIILARHYWHTDHQQDAIRCYEKSLASLPTFDATDELAKVYFLIGNREKWEQTLLDFLHTEDLGLEHAQAHRRLAYGYAGWGEWQTAKPHAIQAGQTWSAWGLEVASHICEGLAQWEESEKWMREMSTSYRTGSGDHWYFWCRRTGRGDIEAAREPAEQCHSVSIKTLDHDHPFDLGTYRLLQGKPREALDVFRRSYDTEPMFTVAFIIAQISRDLGDEQTGPKLLDTFKKAIQNAQEESEWKPEEVDMAMLECLRTGDTSPERLQELDKLVAAVDANTRTMYSYFIGKELAAAGKQAQAELYWRRALVTPDPNTNCSNLASMELAKRHGTSRPDDDVLDNTDLWPKPEEK